MAQYNFEGDLDNISERQLEFINKVVLEQGFKVEKLLLEPVGKPGDNFVANVKRIIVKCENEEVRMIAKFAPLDEIARQTMNIGVTFGNEHTMYKEVLPRLVQLQKVAGVPQEEQLKYAKCYGSLGEAPNEVIIFEDLKELNFVTLNKFESLSDECIRSILKNFAILHSFSFVLKKNDTELFYLFKRKLCDVWMDTDNSRFMKVLQYFENEIVSILEDDRHKDIVKNKLTNIQEETIKLQQSNKYPIIVQGDAWTNNVMFKFKGEQLIESIMIDYQLSNIGNPVADILYMIFNCTDFETRSKNFYDWIDYYHSELDKSLSYFNLKANIVYPRDQLDADLKKYGPKLFGMCLLITSIITRDSKDAGDLVEVINSPNLKAHSFLNANIMQYESMVRIKKRLVGIIDSFEEFGLL